MVAGQPTPYKGLEEAMYLFAGGAVKDYLFARHVLSRQKRVGFPGGPGRHVPFDASGTTLSQPVAPGPPSPLLAWPRKD